MIISPDYAEWILDRALEQVSVPSGCAATLEGSIAAGFGNDASDIDLLLIEDSEYEHVTMPTILFIDQRRVEVRLRSAGQIRRQAQELAASAQGSRPRTHLIPEALLDRCQRLSCAYALRNPGLVEAVQACIPDLAPIVSAWYGYRGDQAAKRAIALDAFGCADDALLWGETALVHGAKSWAASLGETYLDRKWLGQQLERLNDPDGLVQRFWAVRSASQPAEAKLRQYLDLLVRFGVEAGAIDAAQLHLLAAPGVTTWQIGDQVHVLRGREHVFALSPAAGRVWRYVTFEVPLPDLLTRLPGGPANAGTMVAQFERLGLIRLAQRRGGTIEGAPPLTPPTSASRPTVSVQGAVRDEVSYNGDVELIPMPAERFAAAGMSLIWANVMVENAREDLVGAITRRQWTTAAVAARRLLRHGCVALLSSYGYGSLVEEEAPLMVERMRALPSDIRDEAGALDQMAAPKDMHSGERMLRRLDQFVKWTRNVSDASLFPASFVSVEAWQETLELGYDWIRLGAYLHADFPIEEARDLVNSGGRQPVMKTRNDTDVSD